MRRPMVWPKATRWRFRPARRRPMANPVKAVAVMRTVPLAAAAAVAAAMLVAGCSLAPDYKVPPSPVAAQYRTTGPWVSAKPGDQLKRDGWWNMYDDARLGDLEKQLLEHNTDLEAAYAHYQQAQAFVTQVRADLYPSVTLNPSLLRQRQSATRPLRS